MNLQWWSLMLPMFLMMCEGKKDKELYCAVCRSLVDEVNFSIGQVDPKQTLQVGSFRVDGKGNQNFKTIPFARSETHLTELFEGICSNFEHYAESMSDGRKSVVRTTSRNDKPLSLKHITLSADKQKNIRFACDSILEDFEEDILKEFKTEVTDPSETESKVCKDIAELCTEEDLKHPLPNTEYIEDVYGKDGEEGDDSESDSDSDDSDSESDSEDEKEENKDKETEENKEETTDDKPTDSTTVGDEMKDDKTKEEL